MTDWLDALSGEGGDYEATDLDLIVSISCSNEWAEMRATHVCIRVDQALIDKTQSMIDDAAQLRQKYGSPVTLEVYAPDFDLVADDDCGGYEQCGDRLEIARLSIDDSGSMSFTAYLKHGDAEVSGFFSMDDLRAFEPVIRAQRASEGISEVFDDVVSRPATSKGMTL